MLSCLVFHVVVSHRTLSYDVLSCLVLSYLVLSCLVLWYLMVPCLISPYLVLSRLIVPYLVYSCRLVFHHPPSLVPILSYPFGRCWTVECDLFSFPHIVLMLCYAMQNRWHATTIRTSARLLRCALLLFGRPLGWTRPCPTRAARFRSA